VYVAQRGAGAFVLRGDQRAPLRANPSSQLLSLDPSASPQPNFGANLAIRALASGEWNVRVLSTSLALPYLAAGKLAAAVYSRVGVPVHFAAGLLVAEEAGARITDADGADWDLHSSVYVVTASDLLHRDLMELINRTS
jgi:fructose-1,6-bisphosphatase/inositol monophosphatase family enzyme